MRMIVFEWLKYAYRFFAHLNVVTYILSIIVAIGTAVWSYLSSYEGPMIVVAALSTFVAMMFTVKGIVWRPLLSTNVRDDSTEHPSESCETIDGKRVATNDELENMHIVDRALYIRDVPTDPKTPSIIADKTFDNCLIIGPAAIFVFRGGNILNNNSWRIESNDPTALLWTITQQEVVGAIAFSNCIIKECAFRGIGVAGTKEQLDRFRDAFVKMP